MTTGEKDACQPCRALTPRIVWRASTIRSAASTGFAVTQRDLQLTGGVLGVELVDADALVLERRDEIGDEVRELRQDDRAVRGAAVRRHQAAVLLLAAGEPLDLAAHRQVQALRRCPVDHAPQERPLADRGDLALLREPVGGPQAQPGWAARTRIAFGSTISR